MAPLCVFFFIYQGNVSTYSRHTDICYKQHSLKGDPESRRDDTVSHPGGCTQDPLSNNFFTTVENSEIARTASCGFFFQINVAGLSLIPNLK